MKNTKWVAIFIGMFAFLSARKSAAYATGVVFADSYLRAVRRHAPFRIGVINWGYWGSVGVVASEDERLMFPDTRSLWLWENRYRASAGPAGVRTRSHRRRAAPMSS